MRMLFEVLARTDIIDKFMSEELIHVHTVIDYWNHFEFAAWERTFGMIGSDKV